MDSSMGKAGGSGDECSLNLNTGKRPSYKRLSSTQTDKLEKFIKDFPHPNEAQRRQLASETGLESKQIKFWFQNKRTQIKNQNERAGNNTLRVENDRIHNENLLMKEAINNMLCPSCGGPTSAEGAHEHYVHKIELENAQLREELEKWSGVLARYMEKQMSPPELQQAFISITGSSSHAPPPLGNSLNQEIDGSLIPNQTQGMQILNEGIEKRLMSKVAATAMEELVRLLRIDDPFWIKSSTQDGKLNLNHENYEKTFPNTNHFKGANVRVEATKNSGIVSINTIQLVDMFLDSDKWVNLFPTIITKAEIVKVLESGLVGNRSGALQLMSEQMHVLSPLVQPRDFQFLRYCQQIEEGVWVIVDVSFDSFPQKTSIFHSWKHPSGCMIQEMANGCSMVTWIEHVKVDDKIQTDQLFKDLVSTGVAYGAERWIMELQRICERITSFYVETIPNHDSEGVITSIEGRRSIMNFSHRMIKSFCASLAMSDKLEFSPLKMENNSRVKVFIRKNTNLGQPNGMIVVATTSIWIPLHYMKVFEYFTDDKKRAQWDVLCYGNPTHKVVHISNGIHPDNYISILRPFIPNDNNALILQESFTNPMGSYVIFASSDVATMNSVIKGEDSSMLPILPSGFVISANGEPNAGLKAFTNANNERLGGSLLTVAFQILASSSDGINMPNVESLEVVNTLLSSTILKVKEAFNLQQLGVIF